MICTKRCVPLLGKELARTGGLATRSSRRARRDSNHFGTANSARAPLRTKPFRLDKPLRSAFMITDSDARGGCLVTSSPHLDERIHGLAHGTPNAQSCRAPLGLLLTPLQTIVARA